MNDELPLATLIIHLHNGTEVRIRPDVDYVGTQIASAYSGGPPRTRRDFADLAKAIATTSLSEDPGIIWTLTDVYNEIFVFRLAMVAYCTIIPAAEREEVTA